MQKLEKQDSKNVWDKMFDDLEQFDMSGFLEERVEPTLELHSDNEKLAKLHKLQKHQDLDFAEIGVDDGLRGIDENSNH